MSKLSDKNNRKKRLDRFRKFLKIWRLMLLKNGRKKAALELMHCG